MPVWREACSRRRSMEIGAEGWRSTRATAEGAWWQSRGHGRCRRQKRQPHRKAGGAWRDRGGPRIRKQTSRRRWHIPGGHRRWKRQKPSSRPSCVGRKVGVGRSGAGIDAGLRARRGANVVGRGSNGVEQLCVSSAGLALPATTEIAAPCDEEFCQDNCGDG